jgi:hypothetical protein
MIDLTDPQWLQAVALFLALVGLMIWFPIHYWRKGPAAAPDDSRRER